MTILISEEDTRSLLSLQAAIPVIEDVFRMAGERMAENAARFEFPSPQGYLTFRAAALHGKKLMGCKLLTALGSGPRLMWNFLYSMESGALLAIVQSRAISNLRTAAATAVAVKHLSSAQADAVALYGTGKQAQTQLEAICAVRPVRIVRVYSRDEAKRRTFCEKMASRLSIDVVPVSMPEQTPRDAQIVLTITNSDRPVLYGDWLERACLVVGVGANEWYRRELHESVVQKARTIVVDDLELAKAQGGDLLWPISHGLTRWNLVQELGPIVAGRVPPPDVATGITLFKSHGIALEDVAITAAVYELARAQGVGREISL